MEKQDVPAQYSGRLNHWTQCSDILQWQILLFQWTEAIAEGLELDDHKGPSEPRPLCDSIQSSKME